MNDALRKKKRETTGNPPVAGFSDQGRRSLMTRKMGVVVLAALILLAGTVLGGIYLQQVAGNGSLEVKRSLPPASPPLEGPVGGESTLAGKSPETDTIPAASTDRSTPAAADSADPKSGVTRASQATDASATAAAAGLPPPRTERSAPAMASIREESAARHENAPASMTKTAEMKSFRQSSRTFEPDPGRAASSEKGVPPVKQLSRASVPATPTYPPRASARDAEGGKMAATGDADADLYYRKALAFHRSGRLADAVRLYQQVLKFEATHSEAMLNLAAAHIEEGNFSQAQPLLVRLEQASPRPGGVLLNLAITAIGSGSSAQALDYLDRAEKLGDATPWEIDFHRAVALSHMNRSAEALTLYRHLATQRPDDPRVRFNLAITCDAQGLYPEALDHYESVLRDSKQSSQNHTETLIERMRSIRRYLNTTQSQAKGQ